MDKKLEPGISIILEKKVSPADSAKMLGSGSLNVFSTPSMIAFMERTAMELVQPYLNTGESTVGAHVNISHIKPTAINSMVKCLAILTALEGKKLSFSVEAEDEAGIIGKGSHIRYIIEEEKFISRLSS